MDHVDNDKVVRALNFHGQQLTSLLKDQPLFRHLDLKAVDYHLYHKRSRELRLEDRGRRLILHNFISQNAESLFRKQDVSSKAAPSQASVSDDILPPIETFVAKHLSKDDRLRHFLELAQEGDVLLCSSVSKNQAGLLLSVLCFDPESSKTRAVFDLGLKCFCPAAEIVPAEDGRGFDTVRFF